MNPFVGNWTDENNDSIVIKADGDHVEIKYESNGRGPFFGRTPPVTGAPIISVNFSDKTDRFTGVLTYDNNEIWWENKTKWFRNNAI